MRLRSAFDINCDSALEKDAHRPKLFVSALEERFCVELKQLAEVPFKRLAERGCRRLHVAMCAAQRLLDDLIDDAKTFRCGRKQPELLGRLGRHPSLAPLDR